MAVAIDGALAAADLIAICLLIVLVGLLYATRWWLAPVMNGLAYLLSYIPYAGSLARDAENAVIAALDDAIGASEGAITKLFYGLELLVELTAESVEALARATHRALDVLFGISIPQLIAAATAPIWHHLSAVETRAAQLEVDLLNDVKSLEIYAAGHATAALHTAEDYADAGLTALDRTVSGELHDLRRLLEGEVADAIKTAEGWAGVAVDTLRKAEDAALADTRRVAAAATAAALATAETAIAAVHTELAAALAQARVELTAAIAAAEADAKAYADALAATLGSEISGVERELLGKLSAAETASAAALTAAIEAGQEAIGAVRAELARSAAAAEAAVAAGLSAAQQLTGQATATAEAASAAAIAEARALGQQAVATAGTIAIDAGKDLRTIEGIFGATGTAALIASIPALATLIHAVATEAGLDNPECRGKVKQICSVDPARWAKLIGGLVAIAAWPGLQELAEGVAAVTGDVVDAVLHLVDEGKASSPPATEAIRRMQAVYR